MSDSNNRTKPGFEQNILMVPKMEFKSYHLEDCDQYVLNFMLAVKVENHYPQDGAMRQIIPAIKWFRLKFGCGLKEAKDAVELYEKSKREALAWKDTPVGKIEAKVEGRESLGALLRQKLEENERASQAIPKSALLNTDKQIMQNAVCAILGNRKWVDYNSTFQDYVTQQLEDGFTIHATVQKAKDYFAMNDVTN